MGLFNRRRVTPEEAWRPPVLGTCSCQAHVEQLGDTVIPFAASTGRDQGVTVTDLRSAGSLDVRLALPHEAEVTLPHSGQVTGPYHWVVPTGAALALLYDEDAPVALDDCLSVQEGVERVALVEAGLAVGAPGLCPSGVQAAVVAALTNPRVRRGEAPG
jgi:hypothetical protein